MGRHVVCARMTQAFLDFSRSRGNDLSTPHPEWRFPGLKPGDRIVTSGIFKLRNLMPVVENNELTPTSEKKPNPSDS